MINERNMSNIGPMDAQRAKHPLPVMRRIKSMPAPANTRGTRQRARRRNIRLMLVLLGAPLQT